MVWCCSWSVVGQKRLLSSVVVAVAVAVVVEVRVVKLSAS